MEVGIALPQFDFSVPGESPLTWATIAGHADAAERQGFASVWLADHLFWSIDRYGGPPDQAFGYDPLVTLAGLARTTSRVQLGTLVVNGPLRPPALLAKSFATVDRLSHGRLIAGVGAGWYEPEFEAAGIPFERPGARLDALAALIEELRFRLAGGDDERPCRPPAHRQAVPIWIGGKGDRLLALAGRVADGWNMGWAVTTERYRERTRLIDAAAERAGRDPGDVTRSLALYTLVGEDQRDLDARFRRWRERSPPGVLDGRTAADLRADGALVGTIEQVSDRLAELAEAGVGHVICGLGPVPFSTTDISDREPLAAACTRGEPWQVSVPRNS